MSRFFTSSALSSMNLRRASTSSPISVEKMVSHSAISSSFTDNNVRIQLDLPFMLRPLKGKIETKITEELERTLA